MTYFIVACGSAFLGFMLAAILASGKNADNDATNFILRRENAELREKLHKREIRNIQRLARKRGTVVGGQA